jgi:hypothetical protein
MFDRFLASKNLVEACTQIKKWVGSGGWPDLSQLFMEILLGPRKPPNPFKFNLEWLKE